MISESVKLFREYMKVERKALRKIGTMNKGNEVVNYVFARGNRIREGTKEELTRFLVRNKYV